MIRFVAGGYEENILKIEALCKTWHEDRKYVQTYQIDFNPNREYFNMLNRSGNLIVMCLFDGDDLVGAYLGYKTVSMQDVQITQCNVLLWCIKKEYRTSSLLVSFLHHLDELMKVCRVDTYCLCLDDLPDYVKTEKYLCSPVNPRPFTKIESYYHRDIRGSDGSTT